MKQFHDVEHPSRSGAGLKKGNASHPSVPVYRVGELFRHGRRAWPEGTQFAMGPAGPELTLFRREIDEELATGVRRGRFEFALLVEGPVILVSYALDELIFWEEAPYCWHLQHED